MIDAVTIFTKGGVVLWSYCFAHAGLWTNKKEDPIDRLIKTVLLEDRPPSCSLVLGSMQSQRLAWLALNELEVIFVVIYEGITRASSAERLCEWIRYEFSLLLPTDLKDRHHTDMTSVDRRLFDMMRQSTDFEKKFMKLLDKYDAAVIEKKVVSPKEGARQRERKEKSNANEKKAQKVPTVWGTRKVTKKAMEQLDFSREEGTDDVEPHRYLNSDSESQSESDDDFDLGPTNDGRGEASAGLFGRITNAVKNITGNKTIAEEDLTSILAEFKSALMAKNVAGDVADQIALSVKNSLIGTRTQTFTSVRASLKAALTDAVERILTQKRPVDVIRMANEAKQRGKVFSICFLGVNGVGKSTNLAKVAYYLKHKGHLNVMIVACDTFRAGAVEQLRTHTRNLGVRLFEQGYGKDPSQIAKQGLKVAAAEGYEVVLIDTAGRMQDNEPLMRALAKLVAVNTPDLVLFVGEALVGNDAIDQLVKFDRSLIDFAPVEETNPRGIDGIILTKFDTVDDKVGAALSMSYVSGQPVVFVGTGQKYTHLQALKVPAVLKALLG